MAAHALTGNLIDLHSRRIIPTRIGIVDGRITFREAVDRAENYIMPGFIDAHVHIESSMMVPSEFARLAVRHGTVATVSDPHEIANVLGSDGVRFMTANGRQTPFKFHWGAPSCVPATSFETAGSVMTAEDIRELFERDGLGYLSEMMNYPGVIHGDSDVMAKIRVALERNRPVDGHAPGLRGDDMRRYAAAGISSDHECFTLDEALEKIDAGMHILIREGSAAKNFAALEPLIKSHPQRCMFCTDDLHPDSLVAGHINKLAARAVANGGDLYDVLTTACVNPVIHYRLPVGLLRIGDAADFIVVDQLHEFRIQQTWIDGQCVFQGGEARMPQVPCESPNNFAADAIDIRHLRLKIKGDSVRVIGVRDGQLITDALIRPTPHVDGILASDTTSDLLKLVVVNRYAIAPPAVAIIHGFGLKHGAIAGSVAHDSHNVVAVGTSDEEIVRAINDVIRHRGGLTVCNGFKTDTIPLEVAGLMSRDGAAAAAGYARLDAAAKALGTTLAAPFMTLSFMALLVIPSLKLSDRGLFDGTKFEFVNLFV